MTAILRGRVSPVIGSRMNAGSRRIGAEEPGEHGEREQAAGFVNRRFPRCFPLLFRGEAAGGGGVVGHVLRVQTKNWIVYIMLGGGLPREYVLVGGAKMLSAT